MLQAMKFSSGIKLKRVVQIGFFLVWLYLLASSYGYAIMYSTTPGAKESVPKQWPPETRLPLSKHRFTLITFIHPKCSCSRATLRELNRIVSNCGVKLQPVIVFLVPEGLEEDWARGDLYETAKSIPGTNIVMDRDGKEAKTFNCLTSGHSLLYNEAGELQFDGGVTPSRGHEGDNLGKSAIENLVMQRQCQTNSNQVFGCPLQER